MSHAVLTGPIRGAVTLDDGREVDVTPAVIYVESPAVAEQVADAIGDRYALEGHPHHTDGVPFKHVLPFRSRKGGKR